MKDMSKINTVRKTVVASFIIKHSKLTMSNRENLLSCYQVILMPFKKRNAIFDFSEFWITKIIKNLKFTELLQGCRDCVFRHHTFIFKEEHFFRA